MLEIQIYKNGVLLPTSSITNISDRDEIMFTITGSRSDYDSIPNIELFLEDYKVPLSMSNNELVLKSQASNLFRESFGYSSVRLFGNDALITEIVFNVSTNEEKFKNIKTMLKYLVDNNERVIDVCFSRTKYKASNDGEYKASYESFISLSEKITNRFKINRNILIKDLRHRLELITETANERNFYNINPDDIISNLDQIHQGYSENSLFLFGKIYSLDNIPRENHRENYDLIENQILLGGIISIKETLLNILYCIKDTSTELSYDKEYEVIKPYSNSKNLFIEDLYVQITTDGMIKRINSIINIIDELLYFLQVKLNVSFQGFIAPKLTPYARKSSFYLSLYTYLNEWYSLGSPNIGVNRNLTKIKSTSKIYELFTLYKLIEGLYNEGWEVTNSIEHPIYFIPSQVEFVREDIKLILFYEKKVYGFSKFTQDNELVALNKNSSKSKYNYYNPDFLIVKTRGEDVSYYVLDSKYSSSHTLRNYKVLDSLYEKYYSNLAIYNSGKNILEKSGIKAVQAIHPFGDHELNKWSSQLPKVIPEVSSILLSQNENSLYKIIDSFIL